AVAERIKEAVESRRDWPGGVPEWTVSIGVAEYPADANEPESLLKRLEVALLYVKEKLGREQIIHFQHVPRFFKAAKLNTSLDGTLEIFDPATVLQSIATSKKSGIMTVDNSQGQNMWVFFKDGWMTKSRLDKMKGDAAVIEFLTTFQDGDFKFREYTTLDR